MKPLKKFSLGFVLGLVLVLVFVQMPTAFSVEPTASENVLRFLNDVVELNMTKYDARLGSVLPFPISGIGAPAMDIVEYTLTSDGSKMDAVCYVRNNMVFWCKLYPLEGSPFFAQPATNALDSTKRLLNKYQAYSSVSHLQPVRSVLDMVTELKPTTRVVGDVRLEITIEEDRTSIQWMNAVNGITNTYNVVLLSFRNGAFEFFCDAWNRYAVGSANVKVNREEAIGIAKDHAQQRLRADVGSEAASKVTFVEPMYALLTMQPRENALYPHWEILLGLDKALPTGGGLRVSVWADTGEVPYIAYSGSYGASPSEENSAALPEPDQSNSTQEGANNPPISTYLITIATATIVAVVVAVVVLKKRSK